VGSGLVRASLWRSVWVVAWCAYRCGERGMGRTVATSSEDVRLECTEPLLQLEARLDARKDAKAGLWLVTGG